MAVSPDDRTGWAPLAGFDQDDWVRLGRFAETPAKDSLALFTQLRDYNMRMLRSLTPEDWSRRGLHAERERQAFATWPLTWPVMIAIMFARSRRSFRRTSNRDDAAPPACGRDSIRATPACAEHKPAQSAKRTASRQAEAGDPDGEQTWKLFPYSYSTL